MKKRGLAMLLAALMLAYAFPAFAGFDPPGTYDIRIRSRSSRIAGLMRVGKTHLPTNINYISLKKPITLSMIDTSPSIKGKVVAIHYKVSHKDKYTTQHIVGCRSLRLTCDAWPHITVEGSFELPLLVNGGKVTSMNIDGGQVTLKNVTITDVIQVRGENTRVNFENCVFEEGAKVQVSPTVTILENGREIE